MSEGPNRTVRSAYIPLTRLGFPFLRACFTDHHLHHRPLIHFAEQAPQPIRVTSPFLRGVKGPGRLCEESGPPSDSPSQDIPDPFAAGSSDFRKRQKSHQHPEDMSHSPGMSGPAPYPLHASSPLSGVPRPWTGPPVPHHSPAFPPGMGAPAGPPVPHLITPKQAEAAAMTLKEMSQFLPQRLGTGEFMRLGKLFASPAGVNVDLNSLVANLRGAVDAGTLSRWREAVQVGLYADLQGQMRNRAGPPVPFPRGPEPGSSMTSHPLSRPSVSAHAAPRAASQAHPPATERSLAAALGGMEVYAQTLPDDTIQIFGDVSASPDRTLSTGAEEEASALPQVKWFPAPPLDFGKKPGGIAVEQGNATVPCHSLDYLYHRALKAQKRKQGMEQPPAQEKRSASPQEDVLLANLAQAMADVDAARKAGLSGTADGPDGVVDAEEERESKETKELARLLRAQNTAVTVP